MGVPSLNDLAVDGTLNTINQPTSKLKICRIVATKLSSITVLSSSLFTLYHCEVQPGYYI